MSLYEKFKRGLLGRNPLPKLPRVFTTKGRYDITTFHVEDRDGREIALHRSDAVIIMHGLQVALKTNDH